MEKEAPFATLSCLPPLFPVFIAPLCPPDIAGLVCGYCSLVPLYYSLRKKRPYAPGSVPLPVCARTAVTSSPSLIYAPPPSFPHAKVFLVADTGVYMNTECIFLLRPYLLLCVKYP